MEIIIPIAAAAVALYFVYLKVQERKDGDE